MMGGFFQVQLANHNQLMDHYASKHPKEKPPSESGWYIYLNIYGDLFLSERLRMYLLSSTWMCNLNLNLSLCASFSLEHLQWIGIVLILSQEITSHAEKTCVFKNFKDGTTKNLMHAKWSHFLEVRGPQMAQVNHFRETRWWMFSTSHSDIIRNLISFVNGSLKFIKEKMN